LLKVSSAKQKNRFERRKIKDFMNVQKEEKMKEN